MRQQQLNRYYGYLAATGALTDSTLEDVTFGLSAAIGRGETDEKSATATMLACKASVFRQSGSPAPKDLYQLLMSLTLCGDSQKG